MIHVLRSMSDPPEFHAQFIAMCDSEGHSIEVQWTGPGELPDGSPNTRVLDRLAHLHAVGVTDEHITLAGLRDNVLHPHYRPSDIADALHTWSDDDFA